MILSIAIVNFLVGISIGICGIAGFLLPIFYTGVLTFGISESMTMSFCAFIVSGVIGSYSYNKTKDINFKFATKLAIGSIIGSIVGVYISNVIPVVYSKRILYSMVLFSGISILLRKNNTSKKSNLQNFKSNNKAIIILGIILATISSLSGAGGPVLSVPILALMGFSIRESVGISLFNSIFIATPAFIGYLQNVQMYNLTPILIICALSHGVGIFIGSKSSDRINQNILKQSVGIGSALLSVYMIINTF